MGLRKHKNFIDLIKIAKNNPNTISLILFGSYARNEQKPNSDIDIAIFRKKNTLPHEFKELNLKDNQFDILFLDSLPDYIKFKVFTEGKILVQKDEFLFNKVRRRFLHSYMDEYPFFERNMEKMLNKI